MRNLSLISISLRFCARIIFKYSYQVSSFPYYLNHLIFGHSIIAGSIPDYKFLNSIVFAVIVYMRVLV